MNKPGKSVLLNLIGCIFLSCFFTVSATAENLAGRATVIDGDTIEIRNQRVRLWGIDAPESGQFCRTASNEKYRCGQKSANFLDGLIDGRTIHCTSNKRDRYDRMIASCTITGAQIELSAAMIASGLAITYMDNGKLASVENSARKAHIGLWSGEFEEPRFWRKLKNEK